MEAASHGKGGNQINCMSVNRITSSLTCHESGLKLLTRAWRSGENGEEAARRGRKESSGGEEERIWGFPSQLGLPPPPGSSGLQLS